MKNNSVRFKRTSNSSKRDSRGSNSSQDQRIRVAVRARPLNSNETGERVVWRFQPSVVDELRDDGVTPRGASREYDFVFGPHASNAEVYQDHCKQIVAGTLEGYNGTIFAYGQTSSGKTFTMKGIPDSDPGISLRAFEEIFQLISKQRNIEWRVHVSYIEIYNETITDLLQPTDVARGVPSPRIKIIEDKAIGPVARDATTVKVSTARECLDIFDQGEKRRSYAETAMNHASSRSHTIFRIQVESHTSSQDKLKLQDDMREVANQFMSAQQDLNADRASLYLVDRELDELYIQVGEIALRLPMSQGIAGACASTGCTISVPDAYQDPRFNSENDRKTGYTTRSVLCVPIKAVDGDVLGVCQFVNKTRPSGASFNESDEVRVAMLTQQVATKIAAAQTSTGTAKTSHLSLVDLAGSERVGKSQATGSVFKEGAYINKSLLTLGSCIATLSESKQQHVPFRDSKLTHLLSTSLGGNASTFVVCAISPASRIEVKQYPRCSLPPGQRVSSTTCTKIVGMIQPTW